MGVPRQVHLQCPWRAHLANQHIVECPMRTPPAHLEVEHEALQREAEHGRQLAQLQLPRGSDLQEKLDTLSQLPS